MVYRWGNIHTINDISTAMKRLASGETAIDIRGQDRLDEIGGIAQATQIFKDNAIEKGRFEVEQEKSASRITEEKRLLQIKMADDLVVNVKSIVDAIAGGQLSLKQLLNQCQLRQQRQMNVHLKSLAQLKKHR